MSCGPCRRHGYEHRASARHQRDGRLDRYHQWRVCCRRKLQPAPLMGGTKGSHLIIDNAGARDALDGHMIYYENEDGRICILFPYLGKVLVGSTDIRVDDPESVRCEAGRAGLYPAVARLRAAWISRSGPRRSSSSSPASGRCRPARTVLPAASRATISAPSSSCRMAACRCCA